MHLVTCPNCKESVVFSNDQCPNCKEKRPVSVPDLEPAPIAAVAAQPKDAPSPKAGGRGLRFFLLAIFFLWLTVWTLMLVSGERSLLNALDITNPSALGLAAFVSIVIYGFIRPPRKDQAK
jgi:hypothetical protein